MDKQIVVDYMKCTGCRLCEIACSLREKEVFNLANARIRVRSFFPSIEIPTLCWRCEDPPCVGECPEDALERTDFGVITVNRDLCTGCGICKDACPAHAIFLTSEGYPLICDLCGGQEMPRCVAICPSNALEYRLELSAQKHRLVSPEERAEEMRGKIWGGGRESN